MNLAAGSNVRVLVVTAVAIAVYIPVLFSGFVWDDASMLGRGYESLPSFEHGYERPLSRLSLGIDQSIWGDRPFGYHLTNVLLHSLNSVLVYLLALLLMGGGGVPLAAALLFALHPINTEPVAWISARAHLLGTAFLLSAFICYVRFRENTSYKALAVGSLLALFAAMSFQSALVFPLIVLFSWVTAVDAKAENRNLLLTIGASSLVVLVYVLLLRGPGEFFPSGGMTYDGLGEVLSSIGYYVRKLLLPYGLNVMPSARFEVQTVIFALLPFFAIGLLYIEKFRQAAFFAAWIVIGMLPSLMAVISAVDYPLAERYVYLPSVGFCLLFAWSIGNVRNRRLMAALLAPVILLYALGTYERLGDWKDDLSLWSDAAVKSPEYSAVRLNYGVALLRNGQIAEGESELALALKLKDIGARHSEFFFSVFSPEDTDQRDALILEFFKRYNDEPDSYYKLGGLYYVKANKEEDPDLALKDFRKATDYFEEAVRVYPDYVTAHYFLAITYLKLRDVEHAVEHLKEVKIRDVENAFGKDADMLLALLNAVRQGGVAAPAPGSN